MDSDTRPSGAAEAGQFCHWHGGPSETAVAVKLVERNSGPPALLYACAPCREQRRLSPLEQVA